MIPGDKPLVWLHGEIKTPPLSREARLEAGFLLRRLQRGDNSRCLHRDPCPSWGAVATLRVMDVGLTWRIMYRRDADAIVVLEVFAKKTPTTPRSVIDACKRRLREYDDA